MPTRPEITGCRDLTFSRWIRGNLPSSDTGCIVSDLDFIISNYKTKRLMLLETKTRNTDLRVWQKRLFKDLDSWIRQGIENDKRWVYLGFHTIKFENTFFNDGKVYFDVRETTEEKLKTALCQIFGKI